MSEGVEWALHCCLALAWLDDEQPVSTAKFAANYDVPPTYLNKQLQALVRAGILTSTPGRYGGFRLARPAEEITLMDVVGAVEGREDAFRCTEIRRHGSGAEIPSTEFEGPCAVSTAMRTAEVAWRRALAAKTLVDVRADAERHAPGTGAKIRAQFRRN